MNEKRLKVWFLLARLLCAGSLLILVGMVYLFGVHFTLLGIDLLVFVLGASMMFVFERRLNRLHK